MDIEDRRRSWKGPIWGVFLILLGSAFLLDRYGAIDMPSIGHLWPLVFALIGIGHMADGRFGSGLMFFMMCAWIFACESEWKGLTYQNSWPLLMIAVGIGIVVRALTGEDARARERREQRRERRRRRRYGNGAPEESQGGVS